MRVEEGFQQTPFSDEQPYSADPVLPSLLRRLLPELAHAEIQSDLQRFEKEIATSIRALSKLTTAPYLTQYDQWGKRIDELRTSEGWRGLKAVSHKEGVVAISYERKHGEHSRVHAFAKMLMMTADGQMIFCPMSMTDGCARSIELFGTPAMKKEVFPRLVSRDPAVAFTAGQWMTERPGGSDVSQTETIATPYPHAASPLGNAYKLDGFKWFSSATDSNVAVALARTGTISEGSRGLSLFLVPLRLPLTQPSASPVSNNIFVHRLKNKIGTHSVPTAELSLTGAEAYLLGPPQQGIKCIVPVLNITRVHSAIASAGGLRKCIAIARSFAGVRAIAGGRRLLSETPLHVAELARAALVYRALVHLTFGAVRLLGKAECGTASAEELLRFRLMTPIAKGFAAEKAVTAMEECMAALGGQGYMEENEIGRLIRDGLVEKIWEGTITVLALDLLRSIQIPGVLNAYMTWAHGLLTSVPDGLRSDIAVSHSELSAALQELSVAYKAPVHDLIPRSAFMLISQITTSLYLLEHAAWSHSTRDRQRDIDVEAFRRWVDEGGLKTARDDVKRVLGAGDYRSQLDFALVYGGSRSKL
ncbi:acyl-CoA dehydrogenase NM domain-like protein [Artomyces pyxidatus]|uniref:Acyl-CoA dehydrogenase NM domain-like protein n=1 Tax=Artomyces pyxidatus TaxID=48021 RepID=A0ACB8SN59_9AGAM|nr:acyl-CoA dehydrogenase NM domain-like protein [Artomyces pyxidatus]